MGDDNRTLASERSVFWFAGAFAASSGSLAMLVAFRSNWIEALTGFDLDRHSGSLELTIAAGLGIVSAIFFTRVLSSYVGLSARR